MRRTRQVNDISATPSPTTGSFPTSPQWEIPPPPQFQVQSTPSPLGRSEPIIDPTLQSEHSESATTTLREEIDELSGKRRRTKEDGYTNKGRTDGRWHEGVTSYFSILRTGWELKGVRRSLSKSEERMVLKFNALIARVSSIEADLKDRGIDAAVSISRSLESGRQLARAEDNNHVKEIIDHLYNFGGQLPDKELRGFKHVVCAYLLAPWTLDIYDPIILQEFKDGSRQLKSGDFCPLMYEGETVDVNNLFKGWLRGILLLKIGLMIAFGKTAAKAKDPANVMRRPNAIAVLHKEFEVTIEFIAYTAVLAHFALTDKASLHFETPGSPFSYADFYNTIVKIFNNRSETYKSELLKHWNNFVYGDVSGYSVDNIEDEDGLADDTPASIMFNMPAGVE